MPQAVQGFLFYIFYIVKIYINHAVGPTIRRSTKQIFHPKLQATSAPEKLLESAATVASDARPEVGDVSLLARTMGIFLVGAS